MKNIFRTAAIVFLLAFVLMGISACEDEKPTVNESVESQIEARIGAECAPAGSTKANLYFDNTQSMYGYICDSANLKSNFTIACDGLIGVIKNFNAYSLNTLDTTESASGNLLKWKDISNDGFGAFLKAKGIHNFDDYKKKGFYTFGEHTGYASFDRANNEYGPLQSLFNGSDNVNFDELNVFVTDLAEQELNNKKLAEKINEEVLKRNDHSVALFCIKSNFSGKASVPNSGVVNDGQTDMLTDEQFTGVRPFYCLIVGPTIEVNGLCDTLTNTFSTAGLSENTDFFCAKVLAKRGLQYSPISNADAETFDNLFVDESNKYNDFETYPSLTKDDTNINFNLSLREYDEIFDEVDKSYSGLCYTNDCLADTSDPNGNKGELNFVIPLSDLVDGTPAVDDVTYSFATRKEGNNTVPDIKVFGAKVEDITTTDAEGVEEVVEENATKWEEIKYFDTFGDASDRAFGEPKLTVLKKGDTVERVINADKNQDLIDEEYPVNSNTLYTVENESGALLVTISIENIAKLRDELGYSTISIQFSIDGKRKVSTANTPDWIHSLNLPDTANAGRGTSRDEFFKKTAGLEVFYSYLIGQMSSQQEQAKFEEQMTKVVSDVVVNVSFIAE